MRKRKHLGEKSETLLKIIVGIGTVVTTIWTVFSIPNNVTTYSDWIQNPFVKQLIVILILIGFLALYILGSIIYYQIATLLMRLTYNKLISKSTSKIVIEESNLQVGGLVVFEMTLKSWLNNGFIKTVIRTAYEERTEFAIRYDEEKKTGRLTTNFPLQKNKQPFNLKWKWKIPSNFSTGDYMVRISICEAQNILGFKFTHEVSKKIHHISIEQIPNQKIEIQKIMKPDISTMNCLDINSKPKSGWIRVKLYNDSNNEYNDCFGHIDTDIGQFPLYDYKEYLKNSKDQDKDAFSSFSIKPKSPKLLYADIRTNESTVKITVDFGKNRITQILPLII